MANSRSPYNVYGYKRGEKGKRSSEWLGTVDDYGSSYALSQAKKFYGDKYVVTKVVKKRW
jgi:hypothetical protein